MLVEQPYSAVSQVFHLPELVEIILSHLTPRDLLLSQRVSRTFQQTVLESPRLQQALFLTPDWRRDSEPFACFADLHSLNSKPENNRLLVRAFPGNYPTVTFQLLDTEASNTNISSSSGRSNSDISTDTDDEAGSINVHTNDANTTATSSNGNRRSDSSNNRWVWDVGIAFPAHGRRPPTPSPTAVWRPEASWRRMFLSQPPCTRLHLVRRWQRSARAAVVCEEGITMGAFVEAAMMGGASITTTSSSSRTEDAAGIAAKDYYYWQKWYVGSDRDWHFEGTLGRGKRSKVRKM